MLYSCTSADCDPVAGHHKAGPLVAQQAGATGIATALQTSSTGTPITIQATMATGMAARPITIQATMATGMAARLVHLQALMATGIAAHLITSQATMATDMAAPFITIIPAITPRGMAARRTGITTIPQQARLA